MSKEWFDAIEIGNLTKVEELLSENPTFLHSLSHDKETAIIKASENGRLAVVRFLLKNGAKKVYAIDVGTEQFDPELKKDSRIILRENADIRQVEKLPDTTLQNIDQQLSSVHFQHEKSSSVKEPLSAKVSKKLDEVVKSKELLEKLPPDEVAKLDPEFLNNWKEKRRAYVEEKGVGGDIGVGIKKLNKELLQQMFGELDFKNAGPLVGEKRKATAAYLKTAQAYK